MARRAVRSGQRLLGVLELVAALRAVPRMREHGGDRAAVLPGQARVGGQALLDLLEPAGRRFDRVLVAAQLGGEVLGLDTQAPQPLPERIELGIDAGGGVERRLGRREQRGDPGVGADRLRARQRRAPQCLEVAQAPALGLQGALVLLGGVERLDLAELERQQVELAFARPRALAQLGEGAGGLARRRVRRGARRPPLGLLGAGEGVEHVELGRRERELAVLVLAVEGKHALRGRPQVPHARRAPANVGPRAPRRGNPACEHEVGIADLEHPLDVGLVGAGADDSGFCPAAEQQVERMGEHGLARSGLAGEHVEARREAQLGPLDQQEVLDAQLGEHAPGSTGARRRIGVTSRARRACGARGASGRA